MGRKLRICDLLSELGIRAPHAKGPTVPGFSLHVWNLYQIDITEECEIHADQPSWVLERNQKVKDAAARLLAKYGPLIWSDHEDRPWLLEPGEHKGDNKPYVKHLYYSNKIDREFIGRKLHELLIERIVRSPNRKRSNACDRSDHSDHSWPPSCSESSQKISRREISHIQRCSSAGDFLDAKYLNEKGVWLGDYDDENAEVNGPSQDRVEKDYFTNTSGGQECSRAEPYTFDKHPVIEERSVKCARCEFCNCAEKRFKLELHEFEPNADDAADTKVLRYLWRLPCLLGNRPVFAFVKRVSALESARLGAKTPLWTFWQVNGGYSNKIFLVSCATKMPIATNPTEKGLSLPVQYQGKKRARDSGSSILSGPITKRHEAGEWDNSLAFTAVDASTAATDAAKRSQGLTPAGNVHPPAAATHRPPSFDSNYDTTPRPDRNLNPTSNMSRSTTSAQARGNEAETLLKQLARAGQDEAQGLWEVVGDSKSPTPARQTSIVNAYASNPYEQQSSSNDTSHSDPDQGYTVMDDVQQRLSSHGTPRSSVTKQQSSMDGTSYSKSDEGRTSMDLDHQQPSSANVDQQQHSMNGTSCTKRDLEQHSMDLDHQRPSWSNVDQQQSSMNGTSCTKCYQEQHTTDITIRSDRDSRQSPASGALYSGQEQIGTVGHSPAYSKRFRLWFTFQGSHDRYVIELNDSMTIRDVFASVGHRSRRALGSKTLVVLRLRFRAALDSLDDGPIVLEENDDVGWEAVLDMVKEARSSQLFGTAEAE